MGLLELLGFKRKKRRVAQPVAKAAAAQKRDSVRIETMIVARFRHIHAGRGQGPFTRISIGDISRTGACIIVDQPIKLHQLVELEIPLALGKPPTNVAAELVRSIPMPGAGGKYKYGVRYVQVGDAVTRQIVDFMNRRQAERRQRGLA